MTPNPLDLLDKAEEELRHARLLLDRQFIDPFERMDERKVKEVKGETRIFY